MLDNEYWICERIHKLREESGLSVNALANKAGVSQSYVRDIELNKATNPSILVLDSLCWAMGISLQEFFNDKIKFDDLSDLINIEIQKMNKNQKELLLKFLRSMNS